MKPAPTRAIAVEKTAAIFQRTISPGALFDALVDAHERAELLELELARCSVERAELRAALQTARLASGLSSSSPVAP